MLERYVGLQKSAARCEQRFLKILTHTMIDASV
jgi:hypothetical protein